jgi:hypothetical protein
MVEKRAAHLKFLAWKNINRKRANENQVSEQINQNQFQIPESYNADSVSKGTILLLLAVGVIGVLGISRKKRGLGSPAQGSQLDRESDHQNLNEDKQ